MKHAKDHVGAMAPFPGSDLLRLELEVARRADKLSRMSGYGRGSDLTHWLQAEREVLERHFGVEHRESKLAVAASN